VREEGGEHDVDAIYGKWIGKVKEVVEGGEEDEWPEKERVEGRIWGRDLEVLRKKKIKARGKWVRLEEGEEQDREKKKWVELRKEMKRMVRRKKVQDKMDRMRKIEAMGRKDPRGMWQGWKRWEKKGGKEKEIGKMKDGDGEWVSGKEVLGKWEEVFRKVVVERKGDYDDKWKEEVEEDLWEEEEERKGEEEERSGRYKDGRVLNVDISLEEVERAVGKLKSGKADGVDGVIPEILKYGGDNMVEAVYELCRLVWEREELPQDWMKALIFPIAKKGSKDDMGNYRGISLLSVVGKVFGAVLNARVIGWAEGVLVDEQFGFRPSRGCRDPLFVLREIVMNRGRKSVFAAYMDIRNAYPSVWRDGLWWKLWRMGVRGKMQRVLKEWNLDRKCGVKWKGEVGEWFDMEAGVAQGCPLSPV
jgi:hypothetical protein